MILVCPNCSSRFKVKPEALGDAGRMVRCAKCGNKWHAGQDDLIDPDDLKSLSAAAKAGAAAPKKATAKKKAPARAKEEPPAPPDDDDFSDPGMDDEPPVPDEGAEPPPPPPMMDGPEPPPIPSEADFSPRSTVPTRRKSPLVAWVVLFVIVLATGAGAFVFQKQISLAYAPAKKIYMALGIEVDLLGHGLDLPQPSVEVVIEGDARRLAITGTVDNSTDETVDIPKLGGVLKDAAGTVLLEWVFEADKPEAFPGESISYTTEIEDPPRGATALDVTFLSADEAKMLMEGGGEMKADEAQQ